MPKKHLKDKIKQRLIKFLVPEERIWEVAGDIAERFYEKDTIEQNDYEDLQEKLSYWIECGIYKLY
jgi:hypothetical protein